MGLRTAGLMSKDLICTGFVIIITVHSGPVVGGVYPLLNELAAYIASRTAIRFIQREYDNEDAVTNQLIFSQSLSKIKRR
jgi:hypothetical protein